MLFQQWQILSEDQRSLYKKISDSHDSFDAQKVRSGERTVSKCRIASKFYVQLMHSQVRILDEGKLCVVICDYNHTMLND